MKMPVLELTLYVSLSPPKGNGNLLGSCLYILRSGWGHPLGLPHWVKKFPFIGPRRWPGRGDAEGHHANEWQRRSSRRKNGE